MSLKISILIPYKRDGKSFLVWNQVRDQVEKKLEFPGGKVEANESSAQACVREIFEETGVDLTVEEIHFLNEFNFAGLDISAFLYEDISRKFEVSGWFKLDTLKQERILSNNKVILDYLNKYFQDFSSLSLD
jgi:mutator protein MutT